jgi:hypothetical protein
MMAQSLFVTTTMCYDHHGVARLACMLQCVDLCLGGVNRWIFALVDMCPGGVAKPACVGCLL